MKLTTGRGRPARQVDEATNADRAVASLSARWVPFAAPLMVGALGPLAFGMILRASVPRSAGWLALTAVGVTILTALLALAVFHGIGSRRRLFVRWHATLTPVLAGLGTVVTVAIGVPRAWALACALVGLFVGGSWSMYRVDALRHDPSLDKDERDSWGEVIGLTKSTPGKPERLNGRIEVPVTHGPGDTRKTVESALPLVASGMGGVEGRSRVIPGAHAGQSTMVIVTEDVLAKPLPWAGPSAMGESIAKPIIVGMREDGRPGQLWLSGDPTVGRPLSHILHGGMPGFGKTFGARTDFAEAVTRRDVTGLWLDTTKGAQGSMGIRRGCAGYVTDPAIVKLLFKRLEALVGVRADLMGRHGHAEWTERTFTELGITLLLVHCEEADRYINTASFKFLAQKARSAGVVMVASMQRLDHGSIDTTSRAAMGTAFCYAVGDEYSAAMVLSEATLATGIDPVALAQLPAGYFYMEAPGTPGSEWSLLHRRFSYEPNDMARYIDEWVGSGEAARLSTVDLAAIGPEVWEAIRGDRADTFSALVTAPQNVSAGKAVAIAPITPELVDDDDVNFNTDDDDDDLIVPANPETGADNVDGRIPIAPWTGEDTEIIDPLPEATSPEEAERAFDDMLRDLVEKGRFITTPVELATDYPFRSRTWMYRRMQAVIAGEIVAPDGISLSREDGDTGRFVITVLGPPSVTT
jgi:hypothetical protein